MKKLLCVLLTLALTITCLPCQAAGADWTGPLGEGAGPTVCDTGRGYVLYYWYSSFIYYSEDGGTWIELTDRQWVKDASGYINLTTGGRGHREFEFIWTGTEYMMRQSLLDDPREAYQGIGDSPRNSVVTFFDEEFQVIGERAFEGAVTAIRYEDGTYYAAVNGTEIAFAREEWASEASGTDPSEELQSVADILGNTAQLLRLWADTIDIPEILTRTAWLLHPFFRENRTATPQGN